MEPKLRRVSNLAAGAALASMTLFLAACGGHGPNTYLMPKDAVMAKLTGATREFQTIGEMDRKVSAISWNGDKLNVTVSGTGMKPTSCRAIVEAIDAKWTRVTPECPKGMNAFDQTEREIARMQVDEFVIAVLYNRAVDADMVNKRIGAIAIDNIDEMHQEIGDEMTAAAASTESDWDTSVEETGDWAN
jgi:hypothetical protein